MLKAAVSEMYSLNSLCGKEQEESLSQSDKTLQTQPASLAIGDSLISILQKAGS